MKFSKFIVFLSSTILIFNSLCITSCQKTNPTDSNNEPKTKDSTITRDTTSTKIIMKAVIDGKSFYGVADQYGVAVSSSYTIYARDSVNDIEFEFYAGNISSIGNYTLYNGSVKIGGVYRSISPVNSKTNKLTITTYNDTSIIGIFEATFIGYSAIDTINISNGSFNLNPEIPSKFTLSCLINGTSFVALSGKEGFPRNTISFSAYDSLFVTNRYAHIYGDVSRLSSNFIGSFLIGDKRASANLYYGQNFDTLFIANSGSITIESIDSVLVEIDTVKHTMAKEARIGKARFSFFAKRSNSQQTISVINGKYSRTGF